MIYHHHHHHHHHHHITIITIIIIIISPSSSSWSSCHLTRNCKYDNGHIVEADVSDEKRHHCKQAHHIRHIVVGPGQYHLGQKHSVLGASWSLHDQHHDYDDDHHLHHRHNDKWHHHHKSQPEVVVPVDHCSLISPRPGKLFPKDWEILRSDAESIVFTLITYNHCHSATWRRGSPSRWSWGCQRWSRRREER